MPVSETRLTATTPCRAITCGFVAHPVPWSNRATTEVEPDQQKTEQHGCLRNGAGIVIECSHGRCCCDSFVRTGQPTFKTIGDSPYARATPFSEWRVIVGEGLNDKALTPHPIFASRYGLLRQTPSGQQQPYTSSCAHHATQPVIRATWAIDLIAILERRYS
jgi:hypothetical protein